MYPQFPNEDDLIHYTQRVSHLKEYRVVSMFAMDYRQLHCGGALLPDLVKFYQWLHTFLAYSLTHEAASTTTIGQVIERAEKECADGPNIKKLYNRVVSRFNQYVQLTGGDMMTDSKIYRVKCVRVHSISNSTLLLHFLSGIIIH